MLTGTDLPIFPHVLCDHTQDDLLHYLPQHWGQADRPVISEVLLPALLIEGIMLADFQSSGTFSLLSGIEGLSLLHSSKVFFSASRCSSPLTQKKASKHETSVITATSVPSQQHGIFFIFQQGKASVSDTAAKWHQGHHCQLHHIWWGGQLWGYISLLSTALWETELFFPLLAFIALRRNPRKAAKLYEWEITHHLWGNSSYSESFGQCPGMMHEHRACPCRVLTAPLIWVLTASGTNVS